MTCCGMWRPLRTARRDDPDRAGPGHGVSHAYAAVGYSADQRCGRGGSRGARQSARGCSPLSGPGTRDRPARVPTAFAADAARYSGELHRQLAPVVDFRAGYDAARWHDLWEEFVCDWRELWFNQRVEPPSWVLADEALAAGATGILFASTLAAGGTNLVVFNGQLTADDMLQVYDPAGSLPKNQDSWR